MPISRRVLPSSFTADDSEFVRRVHEYMDQASIASPYSNDELIQWGRDFCAVLSGGGRLADKVDVWAGATQINLEVDGPIFRASGDVYCPKTFAAYVAIRLSDNPGMPTAAEQADIVRFSVWVANGMVDTAVDGLTDRQLRRDGEALCGEGFAPGWSERPAVRRLVATVEASLRLRYVVALVTAYCAETDLDAIRDELPQLAAG